MALTYRDEKGSPLSADEVDENFRTLVTMINDSVGDTGVGIASITQAGDTFTVHLTDGSTQGPFDIPTATFVDTGAWAPLFAYDALNLFTVANDGLYLVLYDGYTSGATFDPDVTDTDGVPYLRRVLSLTPGPYSIIEVADASGGYDLDPAVVRNKYVRLYSASDFDVSVYAEGTTFFSSEPFNVGDTVTMRQTGPGRITLLEVGTTIVTPETLTSRKLGSTITLIYVGGDTFDLAGDLDLLPDPVTTTDPPPVTTTGP